MNSSQKITLEFPGSDRKFNGSSVKLGTKVNIDKTIKSLSKSLAVKGLYNTNLLKCWDKIIGSIYAQHSYPDCIKKISGEKTLIVKVRYTRVLEFQHLKSEFIRQVNLFAGYPLIQNIQFKRVEKIPTSKYHAQKIILETPCIEHPKLADSKQKIQDQSLEKVLNILAHLVMPLENTNNQNNMHDALPSPQQENTVINSWRNKAKLILVSPQTHNKD